MASRIRFYAARFSCSAPEMTFFLSSACIMVVELVAGRVVSRYVGQSLYTWTGIIAVALAGISVGNVLGGRVADRSCGRRALGGALLAAALAIAAIPVLNVWTGEAGWWGGWSWPARILGHTALVFFPPFCILGTLSPIVSKRGLVLGPSIGVTMGRLYAWSITGSLVGTFITGYGLLTLFGARSVIFGTAGALAVLALAYLAFSFRPEPAGALVAPELEASATPRRSLMAPLAAMFLAGCCVMAVELAAGRMLSRHYGQSLYTWTSVIGVVLAGLATGGLAGGRLADRVAPVTIAAGASLVSALLCFLIPMTHTILAYNPLLWNLPLPMQTLTHAALVFLPASLVLGAMPPALARWALASGRATGRTVGILYAGNALGSILGTVAAGFWLVAALGTTHLVCLSAVVLALMGIVLGRNLYWTYGLFSVCTVYALAAFAPLPALEPIARNMALRNMEKPGFFFEEESQYSYIAVYAEDPDTPNLRTFQLDKLAHSKIDLLSPEVLRYNYHWVYSAVLERLYPAGRPVRALALGGGGYAHPRYLELTRPGSGIEVVEIDPEVTRAAHEAFGLPADTAIVSTHLDARNRVADLVARGDAPKYDCIFGDSINDFSVPYHLTTVEFTRMIAALLHEDGVYLLNLIDLFESGRFAGSMINTCRAVFPHVAVFCTDDRPSQRATFVIAASYKPLPLEGVAEGINAAHHGRVNLVEKERLDALVSRSGGLVLSDDFAPVENLLAPVVRRSTDTVLARRVSRADDFLVNGQFAEAVAEAERVVALDADFLEAHIVLGRALFEEGRRDKGIASLQQAVELAPDSIVARNALAKALFRVNRRQEAMRVWSSLLETDGDNAVAHANLGGLLLYAGDAPGALPHLETAVRLKPDYAEAYVNLATALFGTGKAPEAAAALERAGTLDPKNSSIQEELAQLYVQLGDFPRARAAADRCLALGGGLSAELAEALGRAPGAR